MAYTPVHDPWIDEDDANPVDAEALNHIEDGIADAHGLAADAQATADAALGSGTIYVRQDLVDAKGDLIVGSGADTVERLGVGAANQTLFPDSSATGGLAWGAITGARISGYPADSSKFFRGDGTWAAPSGGIAPTFLGSWSYALNGNPVANQAYLLPLPDLAAAVTLTRLGYTVNTASGNFDIGIYYSDDESTFTRHVSLGSTAVPSQGARYATISSTVLTPVASRRWFFAAAFSSASASIGFTSAVPGIFYKTSSFPLPASLTSMTTNVGTVNGAPNVIGAV